MSLQAEAWLELPPPHESDELRRATMWAREHGEKHNMPSGQFDRIDLFLNEALANVRDHGGPAALSSTINLHFRIFKQASENESATLTISDSGEAFDPLAFTPKLQPQTLNEATPGGLGIKMIRDLADELDYNYHNGRNYLAFTIHWKLANSSKNEMENVVTQQFGHGPERRSSNSEVENDKRSATTDRRIQGLGWLPLFRNTDEAAIQEIIKANEVLVLTAGTPLLKPGVANNSVFILLSGSLAAYLDNALNPNASIAIHPGECIGELSAIDGKPVTALVVATEDARVLKLTSDQFLNKLMTIPGVARNLMVSLTERMRRTNDSMLEAQRQQLDLEHLRKELEVARELQASMLPLRRPMFPERTDIDIAAFMEPASEVGGDLFDAFFLDEHHLFFCIGDVSGHGIPAAMFMARSVGLMRIAAMNTTDPGELLQYINDELCTGNDTNLFVTLFCAILDVTSGHLRYANGGHCAPIVISNGQVTQLPLPKGTLVGAIPGLTYVTNEVILNRDDVLVCYTDGVTEAQSASEEEFSEERLIKVLKNSSKQSLEGLQETILKEVTTFAGSKIFDDDYTLLMLRRSFM